MRVCTPYRSSWTTAISPSVNRRLSFTAWEGLTSHDGAESESARNRPRTAGSEAAAQERYAGCHRPGRHCGPYRHRQRIEPVEWEQEVGPGQYHANASGSAECAASVELRDAAADAG